MDVSSYVLTVILIVVLLVELGRFMCVMVRVGLSVVRLIDRGSLRLLRSIAS